MGNLKGKTVLITGGTGSFGQCITEELHEIKSDLRLLMPSLKRRFGIEALEVFGSYVRNEQTEKSDIDLLVTFDKPYSLWQLVDAERYLKRKLCMKVDLVPKEGVKPALKQKILSEAQTV